MRTHVRIQQSAISKRLYLSVITNIIFVMFTENIGFDFNENTFEVLSQRLGDLNHVLIGQFDDKDGDSSNMVFFEEPVQARQYAKTTNKKKTVCLVEQNITRQELQILAEDKNTLKISIRDGKISDSKGKVQSTKFKSSKAVFGFYEWVNLIATTTPANQKEQTIVKGFQAFFQNHPFESLSEDLKSIVSTITAISEDTQNVSQTKAPLNDILLLTKANPRLKRTALIIVDPQNDFCEGGSLAVPSASQIFAPINELKKTIKFDGVIITKDWHPNGHISFASTHNTNPFITIEVEGTQQQLWPDHCVIGTKGSEISEKLELSGKEVYIYKGLNTMEDSYSGFGKPENPTNLLEILTTNHIEVVYVVGLAFDFCVGSTAIDAKAAGFETYVVEECTKAALSNLIPVMTKRLADKHVPIVKFEEVMSILA